MPSASNRRARARPAAPDPLRIAVLAPPWIPVPPPAYGGIEAVVSLLCDELVVRGHDVTLFAPPGSESAARVCTPLESTHARQIGASLFEADHVGVAFDAIDRAAGRGRPFDVVHDHSGPTAVAMAHRLPVPVVHTVHAPFNAETSPYYTRHGHKVWLVAISESQASDAPVGVHVADIVSNPLRVEEWPFQAVKDDFLLWMGRMDPAKGAHRAIAVARRAGCRLVLAGPVQPGQEGYFHTEVEPHVDGEEVVYVGEIGGPRRRLLFAQARALLMPIRWAEPFGLVMVEALACGTPVLAFPAGAAAEIVIDGENGFHAADEEQMADAVGRLDAIDPAHCRETVASRYAATAVAVAYGSVYRRAIRAARSGRRTQGASRRSNAPPASVQGCDAQVPGRPAGAPLT